MKKNRSKVLLYKKINIGRVDSFSKHISASDIRSFARLTGDFNPLHNEKKFADKTMFKGVIAHGMLSASLFSTLIGMYLPGRYALIISQEINYLAPVRPYTNVIVSGKVVAKVDSLKILVIKNLICEEDGKVFVEGITKVKMMR